MIEHKLEETIAEETSKGMGTDRWDNSSIENYNDHNDRNTDGNGPDHENGEMPTLDNPELFPEGGIQAYTVLFGSFCGMIASLAFINSSGVLQSYLLDHILVDVPTSTVGWIFSINSFIEFGALLVIGPFFDRVGARIPLVIGMIMSTVGFLCSSWAHETYQFILSYSILGGLGSSLVFCLNISVLSHWFLKKRGQAIGISYIGGALGGALFPVMYRALFPKIGFGWTIRAATLIVFGLLCVSLLLIKDRRSVFVKPNNQPNLDDAKDDLVATKKKPLILMEILTSVDIRVFKDKIYTCLVFSLLGQGFAFLVSMVFLTSYSVAHGFSESNSYLLILTFNCLSIPGRLIPGIIADYYGRFNMLCLICILSSVAILVLWINPYVSHTLTGLFIFAGVYGFTSGSTLSLSPACVGQISKTEDFAKRTGTAFFIFSFGDLVGIPIGGAIASGSAKSFDNLVIFVAVMAVAGTIGAISSRYLYAGFKLVKV